MPEITSRILSCPGAEVKCERTAWVKMAQSLHIVNQTRPLARSIQAGVCDSFITRLRGYMFTSTIQSYEGLWFVQTRASRADTSIHMFFMSFDVAVIWVDRDYRVVDTRLAKRWRPYYAPVRPALYFLETHPDRLADFHSGDQLSLQPC